MPLAGFPIHPAAHQTTYTAAVQTGVTITAGLANVKGSYTSLIDPTTFASYGIYVAVNDNGTSGTFVMDVAYGPAGGGSEQIIIPNLGAGNAPTGTTDGQGKIFYFPVYVPAGVRVSARAQSATASKTSRVNIFLCQEIPYPPRMGDVVDYGADLANSRGTSVTPGAAAFGSWTQISAGTSRNHNYWVCAVDALADTTLSNEFGVIEIGIGPDASNVTAIFEGSFAENATERVFGVVPLIGYAPVVSGTKIFARLSHSSTTEARGVIVYGID